MKVKIALICCIGLATGIGLFFLFHNSNPFRDIKNYPLKNQIAPKVIVLGDSLTAGIGSTPGHDYVSDLSANLGNSISQPLINKGRAGDTTAQALARIEDVEKEKPDVVIIYLGGNDFLQNISIDVTFTNLEKIVNRLQQDGAVVIVIGIRGGLLDDPYKAHFEDITSRYHAYYIPDIMLDVLGHKDFMSDSVHPNDAGYAYLAHQIYEKIKELF